jgi:hypothetical protein
LLCIVLEDRTKASTKLDGDKKVVYYFGGVYALRLGLWNQNGEMEVLKK